MKKNASITIVVAAVGLFMWSALATPFSRTFDNPDKDRLLIELISYVLSRGHFDAKTLNDNLSEQFFHEYLDAIDGQKRFFLQSDFREFERYKYRLDDQLKNIEIDFFKRTFERLTQRMQEVEDMFPSLLEQAFVFDKDEVIDLNYEQQSFPATLTQRREKWRQQLKLSTLSVLYDKINEDEKKAEQDASYIPKTFEDLEEESRAVTRNNMENFFDIMDDLERKDWFASYLNAFVLQFDPHTNYYAPEDKDRFDMSMSGKFEGIGARLSKRDQSIKIVDIITGGPVWRDQLLEVGDEIQLVRQEEGTAVDIRGMRLDDAIKLIKGPKGSTVYLTIKKVEGTVEVIPVVRDVVVLEETYARSSVINKSGKKYGLIHLPKFYIDFKDYKERNAAQDVSKEIAKLKAAGVQGIVMDLRFNGGGSLQTVVDMAGLFIDKGPIVQVKSTGNRKEVLSDRDEQILWEGPLVIMVNELSASASEILAAALQDYKRAVVLGSKQTFGKGTVQNLVDLNRFISNSTYGNLGALKLTTDKFYRINGGSTQLEGVKSDVIAPDRYSYVEVGEKDEDNPLSWDQIAPANFSAWNGYLNYEEVIEESQKRVDENPIFQLIDQDAQWVRERQEDFLVSLNYDMYASEIVTDKSYAERFDPIKDYKNHLSFTVLPDELTKMSNDEVFSEKRERWFESLSADMYVEEAVLILEDLKPGFISKKPLAKK
jgi:carboxyl-terminal processing protease